MYTKTKQLFTWVLLLIVTACSGNHILPTEDGVQTEQTPQVINPYQRSEAEAKQEAIKFLTDVKTETRVSSPTLSKTHYILAQNQDVRSSITAQVDTSLFIIDLTDGGSVLVTGDRRNEAVLAYSESSSLSELFTQT